MRPFRTAVIILGLFLPLVIHAQPFGTTDVTVFDTDFLPAPPGPPPETPEEPPVPAWVVVAFDEDPAPWILPPIPLPELPS